MLLKILFLCIVHASIARSDSCPPQDLLVDRAIRKLVLSNRLLELPLPDFMNSAPDEYGFSIGLANARLRGLNTIRRNGHGYITADKYGSKLNLYIEGGPIEVTCIARFNSSFLRHSLDVAVHVPNFRASLSAEEPSPNHLRLQVYGMRLSRIRLLLSNASFSGFVYDYVIDFLRPYIEAKVAQLLARELRNFAAETFKTVRISITINEEEDIFAEESTLSRTWTKALGSAASYLALIRGQQPGGSGRADKDVTPTRPLPERLRELRSTEVEREHRVFDSCLRTLVRSRGLEPLPLPQNLGYFNFSFGRFTVREGNLTGLSSIYRSGDCALVLGECGLSLRLDLGFEDLLVNVVAVLSDHSSAGTTVLDFAIPAVEMSLDIAEINGQLEILSYNMLFLSPVKATEPLLNPDGSANTVGVAPEVTLNDQDLEELKSSVRKGLQQLIRGAEKSIAGSS